MHGTDDKPSGKKRSLMDSTTTDDVPGQDKKRRRMSAGVGDNKEKRKPKIEKSDDTASAPRDKTTKNNLGSLIGRKRKERKAKRG